MNEEKKKLNYQAMVYALNEKSKTLEQQRQVEAEENQKYLAYIKEKDKQAEDIKVQKEEENKAKEVIFQRLKEE